MNRPQLPKYVSRSEYTVELEKYCDELERTLDMTCQKLNDYFYCHNRWKCENSDEKQKYSSCWECVKEHILEESEKQ